MHNIFIAGGDMRQIMLAKMLAQRDYKVGISGYDKIGADAVLAGEPDYIFLPIPYRNADGSIKTPYSDEKLLLPDIVVRYPDSFFILGGCDEAAKKVFGSKTRFFDVLQEETFLIRNALITAEGAVCACLKTTDRALCDMKCVVIGYGRIGKFLCRLLKAFSPYVTATARKEKDLELILADGLCAVHTDNLRCALPEADIVFNTVPFHIFGEAELKSVDRDAKIIELASAPYGMDMELAKKLGVKVQIEPGLPGRYFPYSAAKAVLHAFEGEEIKKWI
jgi:dipicolinate synthase subunit A